MKFVGTPEEELVQLAKTPADAKALGRTRSFPLRADWEEVIKYLSPKNMTASNQL
jgi:predicted NAD-dependent protein-ADP-ribosyltransferase YbiA (DUF1768 family)